VRSVALDADDRLVQRAVAGDLRAYGAIVDRYRSRIYNLAYRMLGDRDRAEDAAQEAFIRAYRGLRSYRPSGKFAPWLFATASNVCIDRLRQRPFASSSTDDPAWREAPANGTESSPAAAHERGEVQRQVHEALGRLPDVQRLAVSLVHLQGLSYDEAAEVMGQPANTVKSHAYRARKTLKRLLGPYVQEGAI
jgi:RNA polymerase sigma-70 factor (ECF subfamily)